MYLGTLTVILHSDVYCPWNFLGQYIKTNDLETVAESKAKGQSCIQDNNKPTEFHLNYTAKSMHFNPLPCSNRPGHRKMKLKVSF